MQEAQGGLVLAQLQIPRQRQASGGTSHTEEKERATEVPNINVGKDLEHGPLLETGAEAPVRQQTVPNT